MATHLDHLIHKELLYIMDLHKTQSTSLTNILVHNVRKRFVYVSTVLFLKYITNIYLHYGIYSYVYVQNNVLLY